MDHQLSTDELNDIREKATRPIRPDATAWDDEAKAGAFTRRTRRDWNDQGAGFRSRVPFHVYLREAEKAVELACEITLEERNAIYDATGGCFGPDPDAYGRAIEQRRLAHYQGLLMEAEALAI